MKKFIILSFISFNLFAYPSYEIPQNSTLSFAKNQYSYIYFNGQIELSGTYQFTYSPDSPYSNFYYLHFYPDKSSLKKLPYLTERNKKELAKEIFITNVEHSANILLGKEKAKKILSGQEKYFYGQASIVINQASVGYECDKVSFVAKIIKQVKTIELAENLKRVNKIGC